jgi:alkanesulfonate monooxygenase SsuD/methylene tetrahydromethanopterin reductase-like flavin-dependent oxidoreductase (luciferase family)
MGALSEPACRLAGALADGVLFNWLTPAYARRSAAWVEAGAAEAGRARPTIYAYLRVALGPGARGRIEREGTRYRSGPYRAHFARMAAEPPATAIAASTPGEVAESLGPWDGAVDEVVLRLVSADESEDAHLELVRAGAP